MMKKLCSFLLVIAIMTSFAVPIYAEADPRFELTSANGEIGDTVQVKLNVLNNPGITALSVDVGYSAKDLELLSVESAGLFPDEISTGVEGADPMKVSWYSAGSEDKTDSGTFAILSFKIKENAESSDVTLTYNPENVFNHSLVNQTFAVTNGRVYVGEMPTETTTATPTETTVQTDPTATEVTEPSTDKPTETTIPVTEPTELVTNKPTEASTTEPTKNITTDAPETDPTVTTAPVEIRTFNFLPDTEQAKSADSFKLVIQDTKNNLHTYNFLTTENLIDGAIVQTVNVPLNYDIAQVQYQMYQGETWIGQIVKSAAEISAIGENVVRADGTVINPNEPTATTSESETTSPVTEATEPSTDKPTEGSTADTTLPKNSDFEYEIISGEAVITKYSGSDTELTIPSEIEGYKVTTIAGYAFNGCNNLESVIIPEGVTRIEKNAFCECEKLTSVSTPQSLTDIDSRAFVQTPCYYSKNNAWYINDILMQYSGSDTIYSVEDGTRVIADNAFVGGYALSEITLPVSVIAIGSDAFKDTSINVIHANSGSYAEQYANEHSIKLDDLDVTPTEPTTVVTEPITTIVLPTEPPTEETTSKYDEALTIKVGETQTVSLKKNSDWTATIRTDNEAVVKAVAGQYSQITFGGFVSKVQGIDITGLSVGSALVYVGGYSNQEYVIFVTVIDNPTEEKTQPISDKPTEHVTDKPSEPTTVKPTEPVATELQPTTPKPTSPVVKPSSKLKDNTVTVTVKAKTVKLKKLKKKAQTIKAITIKSAKGKVSCKITKAAKIKKYLKINAKGVITFKAWKKAKKGTYRIKVKIAVKGNSKYKPKTIKKTVKITIN